MPAVVTWDASDGGHRRTLPRTAVQPAAWRSASALDSANHLGQIGDREVNGDADPWPWKVNGGGVRGPVPAPEVYALEQLDLFRAHLLDEIRVEVDHMVMQLVAAVAVVQDAAKKAFGIGRREVDVAPGANHLGIEGSAPRSGGL
jgi:hypothetical protein